MTKALIFGAALITIALPGCNRGAVQPPPEDLAMVPPGKVLILPPRDMVQGGGFHAISPGTGAYFLGRLQPELDARGWTVLTTNAPGFSSVSIPEQGPGIVEGRRLGTTFSESSWASSSTQPR